MIESFISAIVKDKNEKNTYLNDRICEVEKEIV